MTKPDTKEIFEIAYAFKTAKWGMTQPIQFLPQAHKFGEDVLNLIEAYGEAQRKIEAIGKTAVAMLGESACDRHSGLFKEMPFHEFQAVHTACGCVYCCKEMLDEAQKEIERLKVFEDFVKTVGPFEIVSGDCIHRTSPSSRQVLNTNTNWLVSQDSRQFSRSTMTLKKLLDTIRIQKELEEG